MSGFVKGSCTTHFLVQSDSWSPGDVSMVDKRALKQICMHIHAYAQMYVHTCTCILIPHNPVAIPF